jgi:hypothetical protein
MFAVTMSYPFDLVKTVTHFEVGKAPKGTKVSIGAVARGVYARSGILGFYKGLDQLLPEACFKVMFRFVAFEEIRQLYARTFVPRSEAGKPLPLAANLTAGAVAGLCETILVVQPFERGKTLRADNVSPYQVWGEAARKRGPMGALRSMYTGFLPCAGRQIGNQAASFSTFYGLKNWYIGRMAEKRELNTLERLSFGFLGGCAGCVLTMPLDVAKSIAQKAREGEANRGTVGILRDVYRGQGFKGLYAGLTPRLGRVGLDRAFGFLALEFILEQLAKRRERLGHPTP